MIFETHAHYDDESFNDDREALIRSLPEKGIGRIINVGASIETTKTTLELAAKYDYIYAAVGVHPSDISGLNEETFAWLKEQASLPKTVAIGEIGLDYYWDKEPEVQNAQRYWFRRQMELARETNLPVIIHSRDAAADTMEVMKEVHAEEIPGVIHCYSYSREMAQEFIKMGYYIGVGGVVTFKNAKKLKETVEAIPLERILLETDCPYMAPEPHRGTRNDSSNIPFVIAKIAELKGNGIELHQVEFSYGEKTGEVLHGINLSIQPGTVNALVGPSGSGKSTLAKLIAGFWNVTGGSITLGGTDIRKIPFEQLNGQIAYVSQENYLFDRSIRENIRMGNPNATDEEVEEAARQSGCDSFIRALDNGYDTVAGGGGGHLSGGEKQRISIARAMLKNAPIVILDEATASVDPENEAQIQKALSALTAGKTLIVIAHRLSTIVDADQIIVIENGCVAGCGKQEELLADCPLYANMWKAHQESKDRMGEEEQKDASNN